jgi:ABC-type proline/glycine betaine transport system ATPase subunit
VFQSPVLLDWRNTLDNVLFQADIRGLPVKAYRERALALLQQVGLQDFAKSFPHELSGGMRQRASIARALLHNPPLLLMDEPFGALDALTREQMRLDLETLWLATKKTVIASPTSTSGAAGRPRARDGAAAGQGGARVRITAARALDASRPASDYCDGFIEIFFSQGAATRGDAGLPLAA